MAKVKISLYTFKSLFTLSLRAGAPPAWQSHSRWIQSWDHHGSWESPRDDGFCFFHE